jgi:hypothetical protein
MTVNEAEFVDIVWQALLNQCACDPKKATRLVMVQKEDVRKSMGVVFGQLQEGSFCIHKKSA